MKTEVDELKKEVENLKRRNKILTKRVTRLQEENAKLVEELETLEALQEHTELVFEPTKEPKTKICPICGNDMLTIADFSGKLVYTCSDLLCRQRKKS